MFARDGGREKVRRYQGRQEGAERKQEGNEKRAREGARERESVIECEHVCVYVRVRDSDARNYRSTQLSMCG